MITKYNGTPSMFLKFVNNMHLFQTKRVVNNIYNYNSEIEIESITKHWKIMTLPLHMD
jgi:hypothetical protein